jgi:hypothetical protein
MDNNQQDADQIAELKALVSQSLKNSEEALEKVRWIKKYLKWQQIMGFVNVLFILIPIILGLVYLPPLLKDYLQQFSSLSQQ